MPLYSLPQVINYLLRSSVRAGSSAGEHASTGDFEHTIYELEFAELEGAKHFLTYLDIRSPVNFQVERPTGHGRRHTG